MSIYGRAGGAFVVITAAACGTDPSENVAPTASFTEECTLLSCTFDESSMDSDGTIESYVWSFGDEVTSTEGEPRHVYVTGGRYGVTLAVTDNDGATHSFVKEIALPTGSLECESATEPDRFTTCGISVAGEVAFTATLVSRDCTTAGVKLTAEVTETGLNPRYEVLFADACSEPLGRVHKLSGGDFHIPGVALKIYVTSESDIPERIAHALRRTGAYPEWTLGYEDGQNDASPGVPDYADLVVAFEATPNPCGPIACNGR